MVELWRQEAIGGCWIGGGEGRGDSGGGGGGGGGGGDQSISRKSVTSIKKIFYVRF